MVNLNRKPAGAAFTLIEMLIVMAIVALLLTIALPGYFRSLDKSKEVVLQDNLRTLRVTIDRFYADKGRFPETLAELADQKYLRSVPVDPMTESAATWIVVNPRDADGKGISDVKSGAAGATREGRAYASF